jgi:hypothetical protein
MSVKGMGATAVLLLGLATGGGIVAAEGDDAGAAAPQTPLGTWISDNVLLYDNLGPVEEIPEDRLEDLLMTDITSYRFLPDGTWIVHAEDPLGIACYHATWRWVVDGDTLRVPGREDLRFHFAIDEGPARLLTLTSPVGNKGFFFSEKAQPDTAGCTHDPEMLPFW